MAGLVTEAVLMARLAAHRAFLMGDLAAEAEKNKAAADLLSRISRLGPAALLLREAAEAAMRTVPAGMGMTE